MALTLITPGEGEYTEKRSRFLGYVRPIADEAEAEAVLAALRKEHYSARHHCYAYVLGPENEISRFSDDGEPSGTAGRPILDALTGSGLRNVIIVVVRYFGGILLGTGGLTRAYRAAAKEALAASVTAERIAGEKLSIICPYTSLGKIQYLMGQQEACQLDAVYGESVELSLIIPKERSAVFRKGVSTLGPQIQFSEEGDVYFVLSEGSPMILE